MNTAPLSAATPSPGPFDWLRGRRHEPVSPGEAGQAWDNAADPEPLGHSDGEPAGHADGADGSDGGGGGGGDGGS